MELTHYKDINQDKIIELSKEIIDIFSLLQQLPKDNQLVIELNEAIQHRDQLTEQITSILSDLEYETVK